MIPSAEEAREKSLESKKTKVDMELEAIGASIVQTIKEGNTTFYYDGVISAEAKKVLKDLGYLVTCGSQYNESWVRIEW